MLNIKIDFKNIKKNKNKNKKDDSLIFNFKNPNKIEEEKPESKKDEVIKVEKDSID